MSYYDASKATHEIVDQIYDRTYGKAKERPHLHDEDKDDIEEEKE